MHATGPVASISTGSKTTLTDAAKTREVLGAATTRLAGPLHADRTAVVKALARSLTPGGHTARTPTVTNGKGKPATLPKTTEELPPRLVAKMAELYALEAAEIKKAGFELNFEFSSGVLKTEKEPKPTPGHFSLDWYAENGWTIRREHKDDKIQIVRGNNTYRLDSGDDTTEDFSKIPGGLKDGDILCFGYTAATNSYAHAFKFITPAVGSADFVDALRIRDKSLFDATDWYLHNSHDKRLSLTEVVEHSFKMAAELSARFPGVPFLADILIPAALCDDKEAYRLFVNNIDGATEDFMARYPSVAGYRLVRIEKEDFDEDEVDATESAIIEADRIAGSEVVETRLRKDIDEFENEGMKAVATTESPFKTPFKPSDHKDVLKTAFLFRMMLRVYLPCSKIFLQNGPTW